MAVMMEKTAYITNLCYILKEREFFLTSKNMLAKEQRSMESEINFAGAAVQRVTCLPVANAVLEENSNLLFAEQIVNNIFKRVNVDLNGRDVHFVGSPIILPDNADFFVEDSSQIKLQKCINLSYVDAKTFFGMEKLPSNLEFVIPTAEEIKKIVNIAKKALPEENTKPRNESGFYSIIASVYATSSEVPELITGLVVYANGANRYAVYNPNNNTFTYSLQKLRAAYELRISRIPQKQDRLQYILEKELYPVLKNVELDIEYEALVNLVQRQLVQFKGRKVLVEAAKLAQVQSCLAKYKLWKNAPQPDVSKIKNLHLNVDELTVNLLVRDTVRADLTAYDKMQLEDPNRGSWELWDALHDETENKVDVGRYFYARDPRTDILEGGLVGIDFGTKSTVVAIKGDTETITPIRVGSGQLDAAVKAKHYENPTVMEFIDIESFMQAYASREGRPLTSWADITTSHTAFEDWNNIDKTENYFAFFGELKQWAGDSSRNIRIRDKKKKEILLPPYAELHEGDFDPIEIYAYYIGLYINNMHRGKIFMEYLLSFPVTYTLDVRKRILNSFQRGLRRSLPQAIVQDEQCMQKFHVEQGVGEPAAYAVCALQEYHLRPQNDEKIAYAVFDFGGGTTDFDFGIWRKAKGPKERRFNYVIEHFGDGGDKYLGGENLLELLAFEVFKANADALRKTGISFFCPPECKEFSGSEVLLSNSQEARSNMRSLMEKLRPFWEGRAVETDAYTNRRDTSEAQKQEPTYFKEGQIKLSLFKNDGSVAENFSLRTDEAKLKKILEQRIYQGVDAFFDALIKNSSKYAAALGEDEQRQGISKINVFLAGNSSKSLILKAVFQKLITKYQNEISKRIAQKDMKEFIELFPPLGTEEAAAKLKELKVSEELQGVERPTAKTGVAIGLVKCRPGSKIKVINERKADEEIKFSCFLGDKDEDGYFAALMTSEQQYNVWIPYWDAGDASFEFYYTKSATAGRSKGLRVENNTMVKNCHLRLPQEAVNEDWTIYLRAVAPATIEYTVAADDEALKREEFKFSPLKVKLEY